MQTSGTQHRALQFNLVILALCLWESYRLFHIPFSSKSASLPWQDSLAPFTRTEENTATKIQAWKFWEWTFPTALLQKSSSPGSYPCVPTPPCLQPPFLFLTPLIHTVWNLLHTLVTKTNPQCFQAIRTHLVLCSTLIKMFWKAVTNLYSFKWRC